MPLESNLFIYLIYVSITYEKYTPTVSRFIGMVSKPENRAVFMKSAISFLRTNNFDGLNLDWEFPGQSGSMGSDKDRFSDLVAVRKVHPLTDASSAAGPGISFISQVWSGSGGRAG